MVRKQSRVKRPPRGLKRSLAGKRGRDLIKKLLEKALRAEFSNDTVDISDGFADNIHVLVVSRKFDGLSENEKQDWIWRMIESAELNPAELRLISLVLPLSPAEIK